MCVCVRVRGGGGGFEEEGHMCIYLPRIVRMY